VALDRTWKMGKCLLTVCLLSAVSAQAVAQPAALGPRETRQSKGTGRVIGTVRLEGSSKRPPPLNVNKNRDFCGAQVPNESLLVGLEGAIQNTVITIRGLQTNKPTRQLETFILDNRNCAFVPHVQVVPVGSEILLSNSDPILHDVHARMGQATLFNVGLPSWRQVKKRLIREGIVKIECDVLHTWQSAYIVVTSSPYFAVTDKSGEFVIEQMPVGAYEIQVWHEKLGKQRRKIVVEGAQTSKIEVIFSCASC